MVLDTSAILALVGAEPGGDRVAEVIEGSVISAPNWTEFLGVMARRGVDVADASAYLRALGPRIVDCDVNDAEHAARIGASRPALSLGDRLCLGAAASMGSKVLTADRIWSELGLEGEVEIEVIR